MSPALLRRQAGLAAVALVAVLGALALGRSRDGGAVPPPPGGPWQEAVASVFGPGLYGRETACQIRLTRETRGVAHPVLPCGVDLIVAYRGKSARTEVVETGSVGPGRQFDLTEALADELGFSGTRPIRWRFAG